MEFFVPPPEDPAYDWKKEQGPISFESAQGSTPDETLDPNEPVTLMSETGEHIALVDAINARFKELGLVNRMVKNWEIFMRLLVSYNSLLLIKRRQTHPELPGCGANYVIASHKFLSPKKK